MRRIGITVLAHGSSGNNDNGYFLLRAFPSEQERVERSASLYRTEEWITKYDEPVGAMIDDYDTAVFTLPPESLDQLTRLVAAQAR